MSAFGMSRSDRKFLDVTSHKNILSKIGPVENNEISVVFYLGNNINWKMVVTDIYYNIYYNTTPDINVI